MKTAKTANYIPFILSFILSVMLSACGNTDTTAMSDSPAAAEISSIVTTVPEKTERIDEKSYTITDDQTESISSSSILSKITSDIKPKSETEKITDKMTTTEIKTTNGSQPYSLSSSISDTTTTATSKKASQTTTEKVFQTTIEKVSQTTTTTEKKNTPTTTTTTKVAGKYNPTGLEASFNRFRMGLPTDADIKAIEKALNDYYMSYNGKSGTIKFRINCIYDDALKYFGIAADDEAITFKSKLWFATDSSLKGFFYDPAGLITDAHLNCYVQNDCSYSPRETAEQSYWENRWFMGSCYAMVNDAIVRAEYNYGQDCLTGNYGEAWTMYFKVECGDYTWHVGDYEATSWTIWALNSTE